MNIEIDEKYIIKVIDYQPELLVKSLNKLPVILRDTDGFESEWYGF